MQKRHSSTSIHTFAYISHVSQKNVMGWHEEQTGDICYTIYV